MREYVVKLSQDEIQALAGLIDAGLRSTGLRAAKIAAVLADKLQVALDEGIVRIDKVEPVSNKDAMNGTQAITGQASGEAKA